MDPATGELTGRKATYPDRRADREPRSRSPWASAGATLDRPRHGAARFEDVAWDLSWAPGRPYEHVHPVLRRGEDRQDGPDAAARRRRSSTARSRSPADGRSPLDGARGGPGAPVGLQARAALGLGARRRLRRRARRAGPDTFFDGVSVYVPAVRARGRAEHAGRRPLPRRGLRLTARRAACSPTAADRPDGLAVRGARRPTGASSARSTRRASSLVGVTYHDPDGDLAYCYNSEVASARLSVCDRAARAATAGRCARRSSSDGRAHFEYAQREPVPDLPLLV